MMPIDASAKPNTKSPNPESNAAANPHSSWTEQRIGFMLPHEQFPVPELVTLGEACEQAGFDFAATSDHFQPWQDNEAHSGLAWVTMSALGARTKSLIMGTTVTCPSYRYNPGVVAEAFASLSLLYPGRIFLGVGSGEALNEEAATGAFGPWGERSERLIEATGLIRDLWNGDQVVHKGKHFNVNARLYDRPQMPLPILMAANGPKAMRRAGQYGDGLVTDPKTWKEHRSEFEEGLQLAGKRTGQVPILVESFVVVGDKKEAERPAQLWRFIPKAWNPYYEVRDPKTIRERAEKEVPMETIFSAWTISADPEPHIKGVQELFDSGVTMVNIHTGQDDQKKVIEFYGERVIPKITKSKSAAASRT